MYKWQINPNIPMVTALRAAMELLNSSEPSADADEETVKRLIGQLLTQTNFFAQLSLLLDKTVLYSLDTPRMVEVLSSALLETANHITSTSGQLRTCLYSSTLSQWISKNRRVLFRVYDAADEFVDEGLNYHKLE